MRIERVITLPTGLSSFFSFRPFGVMDAFENLTEAMNS